MGMGIARIPIPNTKISYLVGYNTHTHTQNTQLFIGYLDDFFLINLQSILLKKIKVILIK